MAVSFAIDLPTNDGIGESYSTKLLNDVSRENDIADRNKHQGLHDTQHLTNDK
jgi:hypothetical protein